LSSRDITEVPHDRPILHINNVSTGLRVFRAAAFAVTVATSVRHKCLYSLARRGDPDPFVPESSIVAVAAEERNDVIVLYPVE
jgi:hypothetical protein